MEKQLIAGKTALKLIRKFEKGNFELRKMQIMASAHAFNDLYTSFSAPLMPILIERLSLLKVEAGFFLLFLQAPSLLQPVIGHFADRHNLKRYAIWAPAVTGMMMSLLGVAQSYSLMAVLLILAGLSSAVVHAIGPAIVGSLSEKKLGRAMSIWMMNGELGPMLGPILITSMVTLFSANATPWLMSIGIIGSVVLTYLLKDLPYSQPAQQIKKEMISLKSIAAVILPLGGIFMMRSLLYVSTYTYLPVYLTERGSSLWLAGSALTIQSAFGIPGTLLGGILNDRIGSKVVISISLISASLFMYFFLISNGWLQIIALALMGVCSMMILPVGMALVQEHFPHNRSFSNGLYLALMFTASSVASVMLGGMIDALGTQQAFLWGIVACLLGVPFVFWLPSKPILPEPI